MRQRSGDDAAVFPADSELGRVRPGRSVTVPQADAQIDQRAAEFDAALPGDPLVPAARSWSARVICWSRSASNCRSAANTQRR